MGKDSRPKSRRSRRLNYMDDAVLFMKRMIREAGREVTLWIKGHFIELCERGTEVDSLTPDPKTKNLYHGAIHPKRFPEYDFLGAQYSCLILEDRVVVIAIQDLLN